MICNGFIIQNLNQPWCEIINGINGITYGGLCAYYDSPLTYIENDQYCRELSDKQGWIKDDDGYSIERFFISDKQFLDEYLHECMRRHIDLRILLVESDEYVDECCDIVVEKGKFLGYEVCSLPLDEMILSDLRYNPLCVEVTNKLNQVGLFKTMEEAQAFKKEYVSLLEKDLVGDGIVDYYVFTLYEADLEKILGGLVWKSISG